MIEPVAWEITGLKRRSNSHTGALMNSSEDLITRARAGEQDAFRLIFERYAKPVLSFIYEMVGERDLAEELAQETFVRAFKNLGRLRDDTKLATWLFGIGKNVARESLRSKRKEKQSHCELDAAVLESETNSRVSPSEDLFGRELDTAIRKALDTLDDDRRLVFILKVYQQCRYDEIAEITGFSVGKVKTDLHRARVELRRRLSPFLESTR
ncbi:MAG TPA: sigma-70 family RNA polymerase sigma factor [Pyrinomonadaceae bacterium]|nr:sigma-70 family RNA polymerase sigma factor [Pyrinomonadaceae bacterium]HLE63065.1 sigma-70 family RNA polymerase sigma factor [Pyrinomonadaceae bacterium]